MTHKANNGQTPLHKAAVFGHTEIAKIILDEIEDIDPKSCIGQIPFDVTMKDKNPRGHSQTTLIAWGSFENLTFAEKFYIYFIQILLQKDFFH